MPPLFSPLAGRIKDEDISRVLASAWPGMTLGKRLGESTNITFEASREGERFAVRAVPGGPSGAATATSSTAADRLAVEVEAVAFFAGEMGAAAVAAPVPSASGAMTVPVDVVDGDGGGGGDSAGETTTIATLSVWAWAPGEPVAIFAYTWLTDAPLIEAWGAWLARAHAAGRALVAARPDLARKIPSWEQLHSGLMAGWGSRYLGGGGGGGGAGGAGGAGDDDPHGDRAAMATPKALRGGGGGGGGVGPDDLPDGAAIPIHSDPNPSNFHVTRPDPAPSSSPSDISLCFFDWDQICFAAPEWDAAQAALMVTMMADMGAYPTGEPVPGADPAAFKARLLAGYAAAGVSPPLDPSRFDRMLALRKKFYAAFAKRAAEEGGEVSAAMQEFLAFVDRWVGKGE